MAEEVTAHLVAQMEAQADDTTPSSIMRERGLVWLEGWFDINAALTTAHAQAAELRAEVERLREALEYCKHEAYCSVDPESGSVDRYGYGRIEKHARAALKATSHD